MNVFSAYGFTRSEIEDAFAKHYYYLRFAQSVSGNVTYTYRLNQYSAEACRKIKALAISALIENNKTRSNGVTAALETFFRDPSALSYNGNSADCCLASLAFVYLMNREENRTAGAFNEDYETRSELHAESLRYTSAKSILDALRDKTAIAQYGSNPGGNKLHGSLSCRFVVGVVRSGRNDCCVKMISQLLVAFVQDRFVPGVFDRRSSGVIRDQQTRNPAEVIEGVDMA